MKIKKVYSELALLTTFTLREIVIFAVLKSESTVCDSLNTLHKCVHGYYK